MSRGDTLLRREPAHRRKLPPSEAVLGVDVSQQWPPRTLRVRGQTVGWLRLWDGSDVSEVGLLVKREQVRKFSKASLKNRLKHHPWATSTKVQVTPPLRFQKNVTV